MKFFLSFPVLLSFLLLLSLVAFYYQHKILGYLLIISVIVGNYLFATPLMSKIIFAIIGKYPPISIQQVIKQQPQAIVILGGGFYRGQEFNNVYQSGGATTQRLQYAAYLAKNTHLPIALSGIEATYGMETTLEQLGSSAKWLEKNSHDTYENAQFSAQLLQPQGIKHIVLVTDAWHMSRAVLAFQQAGFNTLPAPTDFPEGKVILNDELHWWQPSLTFYVQNTRGWSEIFGHIKYRYVLFNKA